MWDTSGPGLLQGAGLRPSDLAALTSLAGSERWVRVLRERCGLWGCPGTQKEDSKRDVPGRDVSDAGRVVEKNKVNVHLLHGYGNTLYSSTKILFSLSGKVVGKGGGLEGEKRGVVSL